MENKRPMASELSDYPEFMTHDYLSSRLPINRKTRDKTNCRKYNETKIMILSGINYLEERGDIANSKRLGILTQINDTNLRPMITRLDIGYIKREFDPYHTNGCTLKIKLKGKGKRKLGDLLDRYENNLTLNMRSLPEYKDYSKFDLLPGIQEYERMREEGRI